MKAFRRWLRPPETDAGYVESIRHSHACERRGGVGHLLVSAGCLAGLILYGYLLDWPTNWTITELPESYLYGLHGSYIGTAGGALAALFLYSLEVHPRCRPLLYTCLVITVLVVALLTVFWVPSFVSHRIGDAGARAGFGTATVDGTVAGFLLCAMFWNAIRALERLTGA